MLLLHYLRVTNAFLEVTVPGMMVKGDKITVAFHNVMVIGDLGSDGRGRPAYSYRQYRRF